MRVYSNANFNPDSKEPEFWAFFVISENKEHLEQLQEGMPDYQLYKWIRGGTWALCREIEWDKGKGLAAIQEELAFYRTVGEELNWEAQSTPGLPLGEREIDQNFYPDPNAAMRAWLTFGKEWDCEDYVTPVDMSQL